jgi:imidazoleglycerol-phosphate dehydratase
MPAAKARRAARRATIRRATKETDIRVALVLDGQAEVSVATGVPFLDHMITLMGVHGGFDLTVAAKGDLAIDVHHTNEDVGLVLGTALAKALGDGRGITRFGWSYVPMDEALARVVLDISGRAKLVIRDQRKGRRRLAGSGTAYQWEDFEHWLESLVRAAKVTVHVDLFAGEDFHHSCEAIAKALGRAFRQAVRRDERVRGVPSSKGRL